MPIWEPLPIVIKIVPLAAKFNTLDGLVDVSEGEVVGIPNQVGEQCSVLLNCVEPSQDGVDPPGFTENHKSVSWARISGLGGFEN